MRSVLGWLVSFLILAKLLLVQVSSAEAATVNFTAGGTTGSYTVPAGVTRVRIVARGADGGLSTSPTGTPFAPGAGGTVQADFNVVPGDIIRFVVGAVGANGDFEAGGGGGTGVFINTTLVLVGGGGGGEDNTGNGGGGGQSGSNGTAGAGSAGNPGGTAGTGGNGGGGGNANGTAGIIGDGGAGGGGINSAGQNVAGPGGANTTGGGRADTNVLDGLTVSPGGTSNENSGTGAGDGLGAAGGAGFGGGGAGGHRESGGGGGYSGGGGGGSSGFPGGGGSFTNTAFAGFVAASGVATAGANGGGTGANGLVSIAYTTLQLRKISINNIGTFNFTSPNLSTSPVSIPTFVPGTTYSAAAVPLIAFGTNTVITEGAVAGFTVTSITCTGIGAGTATNNLPARTVTLNAAATAAGNDIICTYTNTYSGPVLLIQKTANTAGPVVVGQVITYTYRVTNPSTITINNVFVNDVHNGFGVDPVPSSPVLTDNAPTGNSPDTNPAANIWGTLAGGDVVTFTGTYTVTQADIDNLQ
jgi:uncharacterized repeat protein (TIGR01451 family)